MAAAKLLAGPRDAVAAADYLLARRSAADYRHAAEEALFAKDEDLAAGIAALAAERW